MKGSRFIGWLMHLDVYFERYRVTLRGRSRPDLFGQDRSGRWTIVEAKGRSSPADDELRRSAKDQCRRVLAVNGMKPRMRAGIISWFDRDDVLHADVVDPTLPSEDAFPLNFSLDWFVAYYYARFVTFLNERGPDIEEITINGRSFIASTIPGSTITIGVLSKIYSIFRSESFQGAPNALDDLSGAAIIGLYGQIVDALAGVDEISDAGRSLAVGRDGVLITAPLPARS